MSYITAHEEGMFSFSDLATTDGPGARSFYTQLFGWTVNVKEADAFSRGDFGDPAAIHGHDMPGLAALESGYERIDVEYTATEAGGRIRYRTSSPRLVDALHAWFDAQLMDHGSHTEEG